MSEGGHDAGGASMLRRSHWDQKHLLDIFPNSLKLREHRSTGFIEGSGVALLKD